MWLLCDQYLPILIQRSDGSQPACQQMQHGTTNRRRSFAYLNVSPQTLRKNLKTKCVSENYPLEAVQSKANTIWDHLQGKNKVCCSYKWLVRAVWQQGSLRLIKLVATSRNCYKGFWQRGCDGMKKVFAQLRKKKVIIMFNKIHVKRDSQTWLMVTL